MRRLLVETPTMPGLVIAERVGWTGSISWLRENIARLRPEYAPADPADRLAWLPGDAVQCDLWFPPVKIPTGAGQHASPPVLVMVAAYSRFIVWRACEAMASHQRRLASTAAGAEGRLFAHLGFVQPTNELALWLPG